MWKKYLSILATIALSFSLFQPTMINAAGGITLFTPYTGISVTPGETITYDIEVFNDSSQVQQLDLSLDGLPKGWNYNLSSGSHSINEIAVSPNQSEEFTIDLEVPLKIDKGDYSFNVVAQSNTGTTTTLPITVNISEQGTFQTALTVEQPNMEGDADSTFSYSLELNNRTAEEQNYSLTAQPPEGWQVTFKADSKNVTSVKVKSRESKTVDVEVTPAENVKEGTYKIPIVAQSGNTKSEATLEAVITGSYSLELTTDTGRLSADIQAGDETTLDLVVKNTGTAPLSNIDLSSNTPPNWSVEFSEDQINQLKAGASQTVQATVTASDEAIAGDYVLEISADAPQASDKAQFRMSVTTSMLWGWIGIIMIIAVAAAIFFLIRKYGRR